MPELSKIIGVATLVTNRINSFVVKDVGELAVFIAGKHLRWINWFCCLHMPDHPSLLHGGNVSARLSPSTYVLCRVIPSVSRQAQAGSPTARRHHHEVRSVHHRGGIRR